MSHRPRMSHEAIPVDHELERWGRYHTSRLIVRTRVVPLHVLGTEGFPTLRVHLLAGEHVLFELPPALREKGLLQLPLDGLRRLLDDLSDPPTTTKDH